MAIKYARMTVIKLYIKYKVYEVYSEELILIKSFIKGIIPSEHSQIAKITPSRLQPMWRVSFKVKQAKI